MIVTKMQQYGHQTYFSGKTDYKMVKLCSLFSFNFMNSEYINMNSVHFPHFLTTRQICSSRKPILAQSFTIIVFSAFTMETLTMQFQFFGNISILLKIYLIICRFCLYLAKVPRQHLKLFFFNLMNLILMAILQAILSKEKE